MVDVVKSYRAGLIARNQTGQALSGDRAPGPSQPSPSQPSPTTTKSPKRGPAYSRRLAVRLKRREDAKQAATIRDAAIARKTATDETRQIERANPTEQVTDAPRKMAPKANPAGQVENAPSLPPMPNSPPGYLWHLVSMYQPSPTTVVHEYTLAPTTVQIPVESRMPSPYMPGPYHAHMPHAPSYHAPCNYGPVAFGPARP
jgi:hypothetical protein